MLNADIPEHTIIWRLMSIVTPLQYHAQVQDARGSPGQWRTQKIFMGVSSGSYGGHLHLVSAVCDVTI